MKLIQNRSGGRVRRSDDRCGGDTRDKMEPVERAASLFRAMLMDGRRQKKIFAANLMQEAFVRDKKRSFRHNHQFKIDEIPCQVHPLRGRGLEFAAEVVVAKQAASEIKQRSYDFFQTFFKHCILIMGPFC